MTSNSPATVLLEHAEFVRRIAIQLAGADEGQDVAQEAWAKVLARPSRAVHEPVGWLRRVVTNVWRNRTRGERRHRVHAQAAAPASALVPSPEEIAIREEVRRNVVAAVLALPAALRDVVVLRFHEGLASPEIAARLHLSPSGVRTRMQQAMEQLRQRLDDEHGGRRAAWTVPLLQWRRHAPAAPANAPIAIATWFRAAAVLLVAASASLWFAFGDADPQAPGGSTSSPAPVAAAVTSDSRSEPPMAANERVAIATASPAPRAYRGELPKGSLRGFVRDGVDGRAMPELVVRLRAIEPASSAIAPIDLGVGVQRETRSDANAEFTFAALPAGAYEIEAASADGRSTWRRLAVGCGERHVELWLYEQPFAGNATVKVLDASKRPVAGAAVTLVLHCTRHGAIGWNGVPPIRGTTDALGSFELHEPQRLQTVFEGLATATTDDGRAGTTVIGRPEHRGDRSYWEVTVDRPGEIAASITGVGADALAAVQAFAEPSACYDHVFPDGPRYPMQRAADGTFAASVPAGRYHVRVIAPGKRRLLDKPVENWQFLPVVKVKPGARAETKIALGDASVVCGRVRDEHGAPIAGAEVRALRAETGLLFFHPERGPQPEDVYALAAARTGAAGDYELSLAPGAWHVVAIAAGHAMDVRSNVVVADQPVALEHRLGADGALQGATNLSLLLLRAENAPSVVHGIPVSDGVFAVRGLAPGTWQAGRYHDEKFTTLTTFRVTAGEFLWLDLDRATSGTARGIVQQAGSPVGGLDVVGADESDARTTTGDDGSFALAVHAGATELRVEHRGVLLQRVRWQAGDERRELGAIALRAQRISVQAVGPDGRPEPATIWAANWDDYVRQPIRRFAPDGRLDGQWMPPVGEARSAVGVRFADGSEQSVVVTAADREIVLRRRPCGSLELRVVDREGCPRPAAAFQILPWGRAGDAPQDGASFVAARDSSAPGAYAVTDGRGRAVVHGIMPGPALVYFSGDWGDFGPGGNNRRGPSPLEQVVEVRAGTTQVVELVLPRF